MKLYHGTSSYWWNKIKQDGLLKKAPFGDTHVSFTTSLKVAEYHAQNSIEVVNSDFNANATEVILVADSDELKNAGYDLKPFSSNVWGKGKCDWENEIACFNDVDIAHLSMFK